MIRGRAPGAPHRVALPRAAMERHSSSFALATALLPRETARQTARLYAVCRTLDDIADRPGDRIVAGARLAALERAAWHRQARDPLERELAALVAGGVSPTPLRHLMRGLRGDLGAVALADEAALERYAFRVAGTVGLMMCDVLGVEAASARRAAVDLGIAMQFTNIARDVVEDARAGRRYLPATWLDLSPRRLARPDGAARRMAAPAVARLLDRAEARYAGGWRGFSHLPRSARPGIAAAAALYRAIGTGIAASGHDIAAPCARPGRGRRLAIALGAAGQALVAPDPAARRRPSIDRDTDTETDSMGAPDARP